MSDKQVKRKIYCATYILMFILFTACGKADSSDFSLQQKAEADDDSSEFGGKTKEEKNIVVASGQAGEYLVELVLKKGYYDDDSLSAYQNTYEGEFDIRVSKGGKKYSNLVMMYGDSKEGLNFPREGKIQVCDYNGDGQMDFAIGQRISSSAKEYQFFTITKTGKLYRLDSSLVADAEYFPLFKVENGKIQYRQYDQKGGKYLNKTMEIQAIKE